MTAKDKYVYLGGFALGALLFGVPAVLFLPDASVPFKVWTAANAVLLGFAFQRWRRP